MKIQSVGLIYHLVTIWGIYVKKNAQISLDVLGCHHNLPQIAAVSETVKKEQKIWPKCDDTEVSRW